MNILWLLNLLYCSQNPYGDLQQELTKISAEICNQSTKEYQECLQANGYNYNNQPTYNSQPSADTSYNSVQSNNTVSTYPTVQPTAPVYSVVPTYTVPQVTVTPVVAAQTVAPTPQYSSVAPVTPQYSTVAPVVPQYSTITPQPTITPTTSVSPNLPNPVICPPSKKSKTLSSILRENQVARKQIIDFLNYSGVPLPWDQLLDFETTTHHQLPDPDTLFAKIRKQLLAFDKVKTCIVESLMVIEKFINRGKGYLAEDLRDLCQHKIMLNNIYKRLKAKPAYEFRSLLLKRYAEIKCKIEETVKSFCRMKKWLLKIRALSKKL